MIYGAIPHVSADLTDVVAITLVTTGWPRKKPKTKNFARRAHEKTQMSVFFFWAFSQNGLEGIWGCFMLAQKKKNHDHKIGQYSVYTAVNLVDLFAWVFFFWAKLAPPKFSQTHFGERPRKKPPILAGVFFFGL